MTNLTSILAVPGPPLFTISTHESRHDATDTKKQTLVASSLWGRYCREDDRLRHMENVPGLNRQRLGHIGE